MMPPTMGASQNSHSEPIASAPPNSAVAVERAGLTEGVRYRDRDQMDRHQRQSDGNRGKAGRRLSGARDPKLCFTVSPSATKSALRGEVRRNASPMLRPGSGFSRRRNFPRSAP